jgi:hypothetical protein
MLEERGQEVGFDGAGGAGDFHHSLAGRRLATLDRLGREDVVKQAALVFPGLFRWNGAAALGAAAGAGAEVVAAMQAAALFEPAISNRGTMNMALRSLSISPAFGLIVAPRR